ncbi:hypothetical protein COY43_01420 [Candidatus Berkelbacteria bacterium CG_4_10_14_0_8_um_filter_35_9_33_8]|uniref:Uncharacterized protein n=1 Tax=Candidatus Berkelbacteria bacterium CG_4_10_14_0_2_um_filter_35_9_33_12 TaxID=1974499 RepID=A0A2M7W4V2_9BACT|nr:MAG: hypothetical protein COY43_01420 [Candidatus Berkelbacteria bacterium CG_4_10_14_0_8_um_filter_35_9_33_8]PJA20866.1 MAG: hypothetical protein COX60_00495 [Candidatus Berkelbacteria bacterium CG_4_10_14_0_2_um_filter_35_9_33_12]PJB52017.1 MAG: hypothetical protein CO100_01125 [Candidatus Berkelbacteria bacterium CG_4_9_14_3_um_filter_33_5]
MKIKKTTNRNIIFLIKNYWVETLLIISWLIIFNNDSIKIFGNKLAITEYYFVAIFIFSLMIISILIKQKLIPKYLFKNNK